MNPQILFHCKTIKVREHQQKTIIMFSGFRFLKGWGTVKKGNLVTKKSFSEIVKYIMSF